MDPGRPDTAVGGTLGGEPLDLGGPVFYEDLGAEGTNLGGDGVRDLHRALDARAGAPLAVAFSAWQTGISHIGANRVPVYQYLTTVTGPPRASSSSGRSLGSRSSWVGRSYSWECTWPGAGNGRWCRWLCCRRCAGLATLTRSSLQPRRQELVMDTSGRAPVAQFPDGGCDVASPEEASTVFMAGNVLLPNRASR